MVESERTTAELQQEIAALRQRVAELEAQQARQPQAGQPGPHDDAARAAWVAGDALLLETIPDAVFGLDREWRFFLVNPAAAALMRQPRADVLGQHVLDVFPGLADTVFFATYERVIRTGEPDTVVDQYTIPGGASGWYEVHTYPVDQGILCIASDVTARQATEDALRASQQHLQALFDSAQDAFLLTDNEMRYVDANPAACALLGYTREELLQLRVPDVSGPPYAEQVEELWDDFQASSQQSAEYILRHKDGSLIEAEYRAVSDVLPGLHLAVIRDIRPRKQAERALRESERFMRSALDGLSAHIAIIDEQGVILSVNQAWRDFALANGGDPAAVGEGANYLKACDTAQGAYAEGADTFAEGMRAVLNGEQNNFELEYPCPAPTQERWFAGRVTRFPGNGGPPRAIISHEDITIRRQFEHALRESETRYRLVSEMISDYAYALRVLPNGQYTQEWVTEAFTRITGYTAEALEKAGGWEALIHPDDLEIAYQRSETLLAGHADISELRIITRSGEVRWLRDYACPEWDEAAGRVARLIGAAQDITAQKHSAAELERSRDFYLTLLQNFPAMVWRASDFGAHNYVNQTWLDFTGRALAAELGAGWTEGIHPDDRERVVAGYRAAFADRQPFTLEYRLRRHDGRYRYVVDKGQPYTDLDGQYGGFIGVAFDVTARKQAEEEATYSRDYYLTLLQEFPALIWRSSTNGGCDYFNQTWLDFTGRSMAEEFGDGWLEAVHPDDRDALRDDYLAAFNAREPFTLEYRLRRHDGVYRSIIDYGRPYADYDGAFAGYIGVCYDNTERYVMAQALAENEAKFRSLVEQSTDGIVLVDEAGRVIEWNDAFARLTGIAYAEALGEYLWDVQYRLAPVERHTPEAYAQIKQVIQHLLATRQAPSAGYQDEIILQSATGERRFVQSVIFPLQAGDNFMLGSITRDVTQRKLAEAALQQANDELEQRVAQRTTQLTAVVEALESEVEDRRQAEQAYRTLVEQSLQGIIVLQDQQIVFANRAFADMVGYTIGQLQFADAVTLEALLHPDDRARVLAYFRDQLVGNIVPEHFECRFMTRTGGVRWMRASVNRIDYQGRLALQGVYIDITERVLAEEQLLLTQFSVDHASDAVYWLGADGQLVYVNYAACAVLGYRRDELLQMHVSTVEVDLTPARWAAYWQQIKQETALVFESRHRARDGRIFPVEIVANYLEYKGREYLFSYARDITERKQSQQALRESEARYRLMADNVNDMISRHAPNGDYLYASPSSQGLFGYTPEELVGRSAYSFFHPDDEHLVERLYQLMLDDPDSYTIRYRMRHKDGAYVWVEVTATAITGPESDDILEIVAVTRNVTDRVLAEIALREANEKLAATLDALPDLMFITDREGRILEYRAPDPRQLFEMAGNFVGKLVREVLPPDVAEIVMAGIVEADVMGIHRGSIYELDMPLGRQWYELSIARQGSPDDPARTFIMLARDITGRQQAQDAERAQRVLAEALRDTITTLTGTLEPERLMNRILENVGQVVPHDAANIMLIEHDKALVKYVQGYTPEQQSLIEQLELPLETRNLRTMMATNRPCVIPDVQAYDGWVAVEANQWIRSYLGTPIQIRGEIIGFLGLHSATPGFFTPEHGERLYVFADQVAIALHNARLYADMRARADELVMLNEIGLSLTSSLDRARIAHTALYLVQGLLKANYVALILPDPHTGDLYFAHVMAGAETLNYPAWFRQDEGLLGWVFVHRRAILLNDPQDDPRFSPTIDQFPNMQVRTLLAVPLVTAAEPVGVMAVFSQETGAYHDNELRTIQAVASTLAVALDNARLYEKLRDTLHEHEQMQAQLIHSEKMTALGRLMASIAHEINNPIQAVQGCLTLIEEELANRRRQEKIDRYLTVVGDEITRIAAIVRRMRGFYRQARVGMTATDLPTVLVDVLDLTNKQLEHSGVVVEYEWQPDVPPVLGNVDHLKQLFLNLVLNALDAMPEGGLLVVTVRPADTPLLECETLCVTIADTGVGIEPDVLPHIFEPFFTTKDHGSGLGLSISYGIVQSHNGYIEADSSSAGTTFRIFLPIFTANDEDEGDLNPAA